MQGFNDVKTTIPLVNLLNDALINGFGWAAESRRQPEFRTFFRRHRGDFLGDGLEEGDGV